MVGRRTPLLAVTVAGLLIACSDSITGPPLIIPLDSLPGLPPRLVNSPGRTVNGFTFGAYARTSPFEVPMSVEVAGFQVPPRSWSAAVAPGPCPLELQVIDPASGRLVWRQPPHAIDCMYAGPTVGGPSYKIEARRILGDSLAPKFYRLHAVVHTVADTVLFNSGEHYLHTETERPVRDPFAFSYAARAGLEGEGPRQFVVEVTATNRSTRRVELAYGACALVLRAYRTSARTGTPAWRSEFAGVEPGVVRPCPAVLNLAVVAPGQTHAPPEFRAAQPVYEILGDSLPSGRYYFAADLRVITAGTPAVTHTIRLEAGEAELSRTPEKLPSTRTISGLNYEAFSGFASTRRDSVRVALRITNVTSQPIVTSVPAACPVVAYGYQSEARRNAVPAAEPDFRPNGGCLLEPYAFKLEPGQSWLFATTLSSAAARSTLGGTAWFAAAIASDPRTRLAAGRIDF